MASLLLAIIYLAFISLGLPDSLLGAAWPVMHRELAAPLSASGAIFMIVSVGTVVSSLMSDRLNRRFGTGRVTAFSVALTCAALFGNSISTSYAQLCLWAVPYGLGAGGVDAALNNYVALHYASRHMSWLHCMWGVGATAGPYIMSQVLASGGSWQGGYRTIALLQLALTALLIASLPLWTRCARESQRAHGKPRHDRVAEPSSAAGVEPRSDGGAESSSDAEAVSPPEAGAEPLSDAGPLPLRAVLQIPGVREIALCFFCYCAVEQTVGLWASSYFAGARGVSAVAAAGLGSLVFLGVTLGRAASGFLTFRLNDTQMVRLGEAVIAAGVAALLLSTGERAASIAMVIVGLGCAPIYPSLIHATPAHFGAERSQAIIGVQMAGAYVGNILMPPLFGLIANHVSIRLFPAYLFVLLALMVLLHEKLLREVKSHAR